MNLSTRVTVWNLYYREMSVCSDRGNSVKIQKELYRKWLGSPSVIIINFETADKFINYLDEGPTSALETMLTI